MNTLRTDENAAYWRMFVLWLEDPATEANRVIMIQACIEQRGPAPDEFRPRIAALIQAP